MKLTPSRIGSICISLLIAANAHGISTNKDWLQISGFISQGAIYTSDNNWFGNTDDTVGFDFREVGAAISVTPTPALRFSTQLLSRKAGEADDGSIEVDHAMVSYDFINDADWTVGIRAGRYKSPIGWYNETRDVPFTRPSIFLPAGVYLERVRNSFFFENGAMLRGEWRNQLNTFSWHAGFYRPKVDKDELADIARLPTQNTPHADGKDSWSTGLVYDYNAGTARVGIFYDAKRIDFDGDFSGTAIGITDLQGDVALDDRATVLSLEYNYDKWNFVAERTIARVSAETSLHNPAYAFAEAIGTIDFVSSAYYYQVIYRASEQWDFFTRYDCFFINDDDKNGDELVFNPAFNFRGLPAHAFFSRSYSIGAGWHPAADWLVRLEWLNAKGTGWLSVNNNEDEMPTKYWDMVAIQLSYRF